MSFQHPSIYHLRITLEDSKPPIWRDILVPSTLNLDVFHHVIQTVMGWDNSHLHHFIANELLYGDHIDDFDSFNRNECQYFIAQLLSENQKHIYYEYDFSDSWLHKIELKNILPADNKVYQPRCIKGKRACPPEDCGGIWGYTDLLETLTQADSDEKEEMFSWLGRDFNPEYFDMEAVNKSLERFTRFSSQKANAYDT